MQPVYKTTDDRYWWKMAWQPQCSKRFKTCFLFIEPCSKSEWIFAIRPFNVSNEISSLRGYKNRSHTNVWYVPLSNLVDKEIGFRQKLYKPFQLLWLGLCTQFFFQGSLIGNLELSAMGLHKVLGHRSNSLSAGIGTCKHEQGQHSKSHSPCYCWKYYCNCSGKRTQHHPNLMKHINPCCKALQQFTAAMPTCTTSQSLLPCLEVYKLRKSCSEVILHHFFTFRNFQKWLSACRHDLQWTTCWE